MTTSESVYTGQLTEAFAVPGEATVIDAIHPVTGRSICFNETLEQVRLRYPGAERVNFAEWLAKKASEQDSTIEWSETTEERYWEVLEILPPARMRNGGFLVGEPMDHHAGTGAARYSALRERGGRFFESNRPLTVREFEREMGE